MKTIVIEQNGLRLWQTQMAGAMLTAIKSGFRHSQQGFSLLELVIAVLFFSIFLSGILQYHHTLLRTFHHHWQIRQAWSLAEQHLDIFFIRNTAHPELLKLEPGWQQKITPGAVLNKCQEITATIITPQNHQVELSRWYCSDG